jgi:precorrin-6Y C5,15-methyltransferase (decarboxylating)
MQKDKVYIIGIAPEGISSLSAATRKLVEQGEIVFGGERLLQMLPSTGKKRIAIKNNLTGITRIIKANLGIKQMVVLASGDPDFFGIAKHLISKLSKDLVEIIPNVSAMQTAFARIKESWEDAVLVSTHSRPIEDIIQIVRANHKVGILTDNKHTPAAIAEVLMKHGVDGYRAYICQNLGEKEEKVTEADLRSLPGKKFAPLNILILIKKTSQKPHSTEYPRLLGISDAEFHQRRPKEGLITKQEVRAVSLAKMGLTDESIVWDIGSGSGAVAIEASFLIRKGCVYAIEKNDIDVAIIKHNIRKFHAYTVQIFQTFAPDNLDKLPDPTAVFIGGSGGRIKEIIEVVRNRLKPGGHVVANIVALENLNTVTNALKTNGFVAEVTLVNIAHSTAIADMNRLEALNPVFIVTGTLKTKTTKTLNKTLKTASKI